MRISLETQKAIGAVFPLFCTKTQMMSYLRKEELPVETADIPENSALSPLKLLCAMRGEVAFYKSSSVQFVLRVSGILGVLGVLIYFYFGDPYIYWNDLLMAMGLCFAAVLPILLGKCMNLQTLLSLYHLHLQWEDRFSKRCAVLHGFYLALAFTLYFIWRSQWFWSMETYVGQGLAPEQIGPAVNAVFTLAGVLACMILAFSLAQAYRKNVLYFTVSCHSIVMLCLLYVYRGQLSYLSVSPTSMQQASFANICLGVYLGMIAVYAALLAYRWQSERKSVR